MAAEAGGSVRPAKAKRPRRGLYGLRRWLVLALIGLPLLLIALKLSPWQIGDVLRKTLSLAGPPDQNQHRVANVLLVPLGAMLVVFFRVTLGIRVLGPFRSVLLAIAFQVTGIVLGVFFLALVISVIVAMRPLLRRLKLARFARLAMTLSTVGTIIMLTLVAGRLLHVHSLHRTAYFPIVVLCLAADGFNSTLRREGIRSALWRGSMTAAVAVLIYGLTRIPGLVSVLARYPELLFAEIGLIIVISSVLGFRVFARWNPPVKKKRKARRTKSAAGVSGVAVGAIGMEATRAAGAPELVQEQAVSLATSDSFPGRTAS